MAPRHETEQDETGPDETGPDGTGSRRGRTRRPAPKLTPGATRDVDAKGADRG